MTIPEPAHNTSTKEAIKEAPTAKVFGDPDMWELICKFTDKTRRFSKSTKALEIAGVGVTLSVSTTMNGHVAEALQFIPNVKIERKTVGGKVVSRTIVPLGTTSLTQPVQK